MEKDAVFNPPDACRRCGCPLVGNEVFCSACGRRLARESPRRWRSAIGGSILAAVVVAAVWQARSCRAPLSRAKAPATPARGPE